MNSPKTHLGPQSYVDPDSTCDDALYDVFKCGDLPWCDERVISAVKNGAQGPIRSEDSFE